MNYAIISNDIVDVDKLIDQIKVYVKKFQKHEEFFIHCKHEEQFERNLRSEVPDFSYRIAKIYASGRDIAFSVPSYIQECLTIQLTAILKTGIDKLEPPLIRLKRWGESEHLIISKVYKESGYYDWSISQMLARTLTMCSEIDEILIFISTIKDSYSYKIQSRELTLAQVRDLMGTKMNTINNSGNFHSTQISNGDSDAVNMTMTNNQGANNELAIVCQKLIEVIESSSAGQAEKDTVKAIVYEIETAETPSNLKNAYNELVSAISSHITIGTAILTSSILPALTKLI